MTIVPYYLNFVKSSSYNSVYDNRDVFVVLGHALNNNADCVQVGAGDLIQSGNYPNNYANNEEHCWTFTAEENQVCVNKRLLTKRFNDNFVKSLIQYHIICFFLILVFVLLYFCCWYIVFAYC